MARHRIGYAMAHSIELNQDLGVIVLRYRGSADFVEIKNVFDELVRIPGFKPGLKLVADFRAATEPLTGNEVRKLADYAKSTNAEWGATKWAFIASKDQTFGLALMFVALTYNCQVTTHAFRSATEADDWFGLGIEMGKILAQTPDGAIPVGGLKEMLADEARLVYSEGKWEEAQR
jgi:hypothetical protein